MTQCEQIINHIQEHGSITPLEAMDNYGIMRLASRICDLQKQGYKIKRETVEDHNRFGEVVRYTRYFL